MCDFHGPSIKTVALTVVWSRPISYRESDFWANLAFWPWKKPCRAFRHSCNLVQDPKLHIGTHFYSYQWILKDFNFLHNLRQHDYHPNLKDSQIFTDCYKSVSEYVILYPKQDCMNVWKLYIASFMVKKPNLPKNHSHNSWLADFKPLWVPQFWC